MTELSSCCAECGARIAQGGCCRDNFHALLALEWEIPGGAGTLAHFNAVSSYVLQHPDSMAYTAESLAWLRSAVASALAGEVSTQTLRAGAAHQRESTSHVTRRAGDPVPPQLVEQWAMTVSDVLAGGVEDYGSRVRDWAQSVVADLSASDAQRGLGRDNRDQ